MRTGFLAMLVVLAIFLLPLNSYADEPEKLERVVTKMKNSKKISVQEAAAEIKNGDTIIIAGFTVWRKPLAFCSSVKSNFISVTLHCSFYLNMNPARPPRYLQSSSRPRKLYKRGEHPYRQLWTRKQLRKGNLWD